MKKDSKKVLKVRYLQLPQKSLVKNARTLISQLAKSKMGVCLKGLKSPFKCLLVKKKLDRHEREKPQRLPPFSAAN